VAGGWTWFDRVEVMARDERPHCIELDDVPGDVLDRLTSPRAAICDLQWGKPQVMGILNITPDSFSDGGQHAGFEDALAHAHAMARAGADLLDIGGESTRPGAEEVAVEEEVARTVPAIRALRESGLQTPISIDTRKGAVAARALEAGADLVNDVSALTFDHDLTTLVASTKAPVVLMHAQGDPRTMQDNPQYEDVLLDVYDALSERVEAAVAAGIARERIIVDPGIGFGKTVEHNMRLLTHMSLFHGLGCPILLGASRKRFIGAITGVSAAGERMAGSVAVALHGILQGVQIVRVHDTAETVQAARMWRALSGLSN
jgi:dihydropteroate synthase